MDKEKCKWDQYELKKKICLERPQYTTVNASKRASIGISNHFHRVGGSIRACRHGKTLRRI